MAYLTAVRKLIYCRSGCIPKRKIQQACYSVFGKDSTEATLIMKASKCSTDTHRGKKRRNGEPIINHERSMFLIAMCYLRITDPALLIAIFMHDMFEDYPKEWPLHRIRKEFGLYGPEVAKLVQAVSKPRLRSRSKLSKSYNVSVVRRVNRGGRKAKVLKCIDRLHNMLTLFNSKRVNLLWKVEQTIKYIIPMALEVETLSVELQLATSEQIVKQKITTEELSCVNI